MKKNILRIMVVLLLCLEILIFIQSGSYDKLLTGKIEYNHRFFDSAHIPTKIGHYEANGERYNIKFFHSGSYASLNCPYAMLNEEKICYCNFKAMELVNNEYFVLQISRS